MTIPIDSTSPALWSQFYGLLEVWCALHSSAIKFLLVFDSCMNFRRVLGIHTLH